MHDGRKAVWSIPYVSVASFFPSLKQNFIAYRSSKVQIAFLKFTNCNNQALVGCIPIAAVAVHLNLKSWKIGQSSYKMYSEFSRVYDDFKYLYKKFWKLNEAPTYIYIYISYIYI